MAHGAGRDYPIKRSSRHAKRYRKNSGASGPGKIVGTIARQPKGYKPSDYNPLVIYWTVNPLRKDLNRVIEQAEVSTELTEYGQSLFDSCFKGW